MKNSAERKGGASFYETVTRQATSQPVHALAITDEANEAALGLILYDNNLERPRAAHLLRKTALTLCSVARRSEGEPSFVADPGQGTVEERAQLFTLFSKGTGYS